MYLALRYPFYLLTHLPHFSQVGIRAVGRGTKFNNLLEIGTKAMLQWRCV